MPVQAEFPPFRSLGVLPRSEKPNVSVFSPDINGPVEGSFQLNQEDRFCLAAILQKGFSLPCPDAPKQVAPGSRLALWETGPRALGPAWRARAIPFECPMEPMGTARSRVHRRSVLQKALTTSLGPNFVVTPCGRGGSDTVLAAQGSAFFAVPVLDNVASGPISSAAAGIPVSFPCTKSQPMRAR